MDEIERTSGDPTERTHVAVVGGGLAGLSAAVTAARAGASVVLLDAHALGGRARTTTVDCGAVFNSGPRALYRGGAAARVLRELGVDPVGGTPPQSSARVLCDGSVEVLPSGPLQLLRTRALSVRSKVAVARLLGTVPKLDATRFDGVTVAEWVHGRRLAADAAALTRAIVRLATYVDDDELSAGVAIRQLQLVLADGVTYLDDGWQQLVDALHDRATRAGVRIMAGSGASAVEREESSECWRIRTAAGELRADAVVLAVGGPDAAEEIAPLHIDRSGLGGPATAACLELALRRPPEVPLLLDVDEPYYLSVHGPPARLGDGVVVVHLVRYGARNHAEDREALWAHAARAGITPDDVVADRFLARMVVTGAVPTAAGGGLAGRPPVQPDPAATVYLAGDWVGDEGLLADASLSSGQRAGQLAASRHRARPLRSLT